MVNIIFIMFDYFAKTAMRPPRREYEEEELLPGRMKTHFEHVSFSVECSKTKGEIRASFWRNKAYDVGQGRRCLCYFHPNASARPEVISSKILELARDLGNVHVCCMDFFGCGLSDGEFVTLGVRENDSITALLSVLASRFSQREFVLWGRSMGAVSVLRFLVDFEKARLGVSSSIIMPPSPFVAVILDSPFTSLRDIVGNTVADLLEAICCGLQSPMITRCCTGCMYCGMRRSIIKLFGVEPNEASAISACRRLETYDTALPPVLCMSGRFDRITPPDMVEAVFSAIPSSVTPLKIFVGIESAHNQRRPAEARLLVKEFIRMCIVKTCEDTTLSADKSEQQSAVVSSDDGDIEAYGASLAQTLREAVLVECQERSALVPALAQHLSTRQSKASCATTDEYTFIRDYKAIPLSDGDANEVLVWDELQIRTIVRKIMPMPPPVLPEADDGRGDDDGFLEDSASAVEDMKTLMDSLQLRGGINCDSYKRDR